MILLRCYSQLNGVCLDKLIVDSKIYSNVCLSFSNERISGFNNGLKYLDLRGLNSLGLPGIIDIHVHLRGLEYSYKEDEHSGSLAAISGCITSVIDMPNTKPQVRNVKVLDYKLRALKEYTTIDYGIYAGIPENPGEAFKLADKPIAGFKIYPEDLRAPRRILCEVLRAAESRGLLVIIHPEHPDIIDFVDYGYYRGFYRSCIAETLAIDEVKNLVLECSSKPRIHITHISCPQSIIKAKSFRFTVDVTPHHLLWDQDSYKPLFNLWCESKVNPPLRGIIEKSILWNLLLEGYIDAIASDHAPHSNSEKLWLTPSQCLPGFSSLENWPGALVLVFYRLGLLDLFSKLTSINPAKILGVKGYGCIDVGCYANLSIFTLDTIDSPGNIYSKSKITPYINTKRLKCLANIIRGRLVYYDSEPKVGRGFGVNIFEYRG